MECRWVSDEDEYMWSVMQSQRLVTLSSSEMHGLLSWLIWFTSIGSTWYCNVVPDTMMDWTNIISFYIQIKNIGNDNQYSLQNEYM